MSSESMLDKLDRYYHEQGIPVLGFNCKHRDACSAVCAPGKMVASPEPYVGPIYEEGAVGVVPRLLFVSSDTNDPRWFQGHPEWVTLKANRHFELKDRQKKKPPHWRQTHALAHALLAPYVRNRLNKDVSVNDVSDYFSHTRSTRCKDSSIGRREGNYLMAANCRGFLKGELGILRPDIIVTQGTRARNALAGVYPVNQHVPMPGNPHHNAFYEIIQLSEDHRTIKIVAWHPCAHWKRGEWGMFMDWAAKSVQEFISVA